VNENKKITTTTKSFVLEFKGGGPIVESNFAHVTNENTKNRHIRLINKVTIKKMF